MASPEILSLPPPLEDGVELHPGAGDAVALAGLEAHPELRRGLDGGERLRRGEQRLRRHAVPQHAGAAKPLVVDDRDLGPEVRRNQGGLVPSRPPANDHHSHVALHTPMLPPPAEPDRLTAPYPCAATQKRRRQAVCRLPRPDRTNLQGIVSFLWCRLVARSVDNQAGMSEGRPRVLP